MEQYLRTQRQVQDDLREPSFMDSHIADYRQFHEDYQNTEEKSTNGHQIKKRDTTANENRNRTGHSVREFIKFELSDAKVPDKETELHIQKQRALKQNGSPGTVPSPPQTDRMTGSESQRVQIASEVRYGSPSPRQGRSPANYEQSYSSNKHKSPFKIVVPDGKPTHYKVYGSPSYNYPRYTSQSQDSKAYYQSKNYRDGKKLSDYPNKQWWLPVKSQRQRPKQQNLEQYSEQYSGQNAAQNQYMTLLQNNQFPTSYMMHEMGGSTPSPAPKYAVLYKQVPVYYYTQTPKPITEDHARYYMNAFGQPVKVEDVQIQTSEPDKHLGTKNEYVVIRERKVPFKQSNTVETSTQANLNALNALVGRRPIQQLHGLTQLLGQDRPQESTSPVQFNIEVTTPMPPSATVLRPSAVQQAEDVNIQYYQPKYESFDAAANPLSTLSADQLNVVYNDLVQRHRNQEQRNARPPITSTIQPQYYQYTTPRPVQVAHSSVTVQTPESSIFEETPRASFNRRPLEATKTYAATTSSSSSRGSGTTTTTTTYHGHEEDKVSTRKRPNSHKKRFRKRRILKEALERSDQHETNDNQAKTITKHTIHKRDLLRTRPKRRLNRQGLLIRPRHQIQAPPPPPTTKVPTINPYEHDMFTISVDDFANSFDPKGLKEAFDLIGNIDIPTNPLAEARALNNRDRSEFYDLEDLDVDQNMPSYLRQTVLHLREKNNNFLRTINSAISYNDKNEEKAYQEKSGRSGRGSLPGTMRKFDDSLNDNGSEEMITTTSEIDPSEIESKLISTLKNYIRNDPVKEQILREINEQMAQEKLRAQYEKEQEQSAEESDSEEQKEVKQPRRIIPSGGRRRTKRGTSHLPFHNDSTPHLDKTSSYTETLTDPEGKHFNGSHSTDHSFDYNDDFVDEENATLTVDYEDFSDIFVKNLTKDSAADRSDYIYGDSGEYPVNEDYFEHEEKHYPEHPPAYFTHPRDNAPSETRYPSSYKSSFGPFDHRTGMKFKYVPVTVFKKVPIEPAEDESLHIDNVNIFEGHSHGPDYHSHGHGPRRPRPPKKYRKKPMWHHSRPKKHLHSHKRRRPSHSKLRQRFPKIKWLLEHWRDWAFIKGTNLGLKTDKAERQLNAEWIKQFNSG